MATVLPANGPEFDAPLISLRQYQALRGLSSGEGRWPGVLGIFDGKGRLREPVEPFVGGHNGGDEALKGVEVFVPRGPCRRTQRWLERVSRDGGFTRIRASFLVG